MLKRCHTGKSLPRQLQLNQCLLQLSRSFQLIPLSSHIVCHILEHVFIRIICKLIHWIILDLLTGLGGQFVYTRQDGILSSRDRAFLLSLLAAATPGNAQTLRRTIHMELHFVLASLFQLVSKRRNTC